VTVETIQSSYPKLCNLIDEEFSHQRYLLVIDENYNDEDTEEFDAIDPEDYNYLIYITELISEAIGEKSLLEAIKKLQNHKDISEIYVSEIDLYGIQTNLDEEGIAQMILGAVEEVLV
jgi:rubrerythrin